MEQVHLFVYALKFKSRLQGSEDLSDCVCVTVANSDENAASTVYAELSASNVSDIQDMQILYVFPVALLSTAVHAILTQYTNARTGVVALAYE